jgi:hypothetical protein
MKLRRRLRLAAGYLSILVVVAAGFVSIAGFGAEEEAVVPEQASHRARMNGIAESIRIYGTPDRKKAELPLLPEPVLRYADPTRKLYDSGLWVWGKGRPAAIVAIEFYPKSPRGPRWLYYMRSLRSLPNASPPPAEPISTGPPPNRGSISKSCRRHRRSPTDRSPG